MAQPAPSATHRVFRTLLRLGRLIQDGRFQIWSSTSEGSAWGHTTFSSASRADADAAVLRAQFPSLGALKLPAPITTQKAYRRLLRAAFRAPLPPGASPATGLDEAFQGVRFMSSQLYLNKCSSHAETDGVQVDVTSWFESLAQHTDGRAVFLFTYRVRVTNKRQQPIKVMGRSWMIKNDAGEVTVRLPLAANAVVGHQPIIPPGHSFTYHSGTDLDTPAGLQSGQLLVSVLGHGRDKPPTMSITASIAPFPLIATDTAATPTASAAAARA